MYIYKYKKSSGTRENIFKSGTGLILYIVIKLEQYLIIIPKLRFNLLEIFSKEMYMLHLLVYNIII